MLLDFDVRSCSRRCAETGDELKPGDVYFSVLDEQTGELIRRDFCVQAWQGPPEECLGWWRSRVPTSGDNKPRLAPSDVMLNLYATLAGRSDDEQFRYLLGLLLLRRRVIRREGSQTDDQGREVLSLFCPRRNEQSDLVVAEPDAEQAKQIQQRMIDLLYGDGEEVEAEQTAKD